MRQAILIYNPKSGRQLTARVLPEVLRALGEGGFDVLPYPTQGPGDGTARAHRAAQADEAEVVFAMGGDGTLREVAAGLLGSDSALGPLPAGTTNVLALALGLPRQPLAAARLLPRLTPRQVDVGLCGDLPFLMMASSGLDAAVMDSQSSELKRRFGRIAVAASAFAKLWSYPYPPIELRLAGRSEQVSLFSACNIPFYGGGMRLAPRASMVDGLLDVVLFRGAGPWKTLGFGLDLLAGRHLKRRDVEVVSVDELELVSTRLPKIQVDGDVVPIEPPVRIRISPHRLTVLAADDLLGPPSST